MATAERNYDGPAALVLDEAEYAVTAQLMAYRTGSGDEEWYGLLKTDNPLEDFARFGDRPVTLRLSEGGGEGQVLLHGWGSQYVRVQGRGDAPF